MDERVFCSSPTCEYFNHNYCELHKKFIAGTSICEDFIMNQEKYEQLYGEKGTS